MNNIERITKFQHNIMTTTPTPDSTALPSEFCSACNYMRSTKTPCKCGLYHGANTPTPTPRTDKCCDAFKKIASCMTIDEDVALCDLMNESANMERELSAAQSRIAEVEAQNRTNATELYQLRPLREKNEQLEETVKELQVMKELVERDLRDAQEKLKEMTAAKLAIQKINLENGDYIFKLTELLRENNIELPD